MLPFAFALIASASANDTSSANLLPGARSAEAGSGSMGLSASGVLAGGAVLPLIGIDATWAPSDRFAVSLTGAGHAGGEGAALGALGLGFASARYMLVDKPALRFAPFFTVAFAGGAESSGWAEGLVLPTLGASIEAGNENIWFDASVPLLTVVPPGAFGNETTVVAPVIQAFFTSELGVNGRVAERHVLRLGLESLAVNARYRYESDRWYVGGSITATAIVGMGAGTGMAGSVDAGIRF